VATDALGGPPTVSSADEEPIKSHMIVERRQGRVGGSRKEARDNRDTAYFVGLSRSTPRHVLTLRTAPYQVIHVGAAAPTIPDALVDQLASPGRMFIPVGVDEQGECFGSRAKGDRGRSRPCYSYHVGSTRRPHTPWLLSISACFLVAHPPRHMASGQGREWRGHAFQAVRREGEFNSSAICPI
jgi:hypothetical protein